MHFEPPNLCSRLYNGPLSLSLSFSVFFPSDSKSFFFGHKRRRYCRCLAIGICFFSFASFFYIYPFFHLSVTRGVYNIILFFFYSSLLKYYISTEELLFALRSALCCYYPCIRDFLNFTVARLFCRVRSRAWLKFILLHLLN